MRNVFLLVSLLIPAIASAVPTAGSPQTGAQQVTVPLHFEQQRPYVLQSDF